MNKLKLYSVAFIASVSCMNAQDVNQATKAIDAEKYDSAKSILKSIIKADPSNGKANFILGNVYLIESVNDSAVMAYKKGLEGKDGADLNYAGLGEIDLDKGNTAAAEANFALAIKNARRKDVDGLIAIGQAYTNSAKPNYKKAIEVLLTAKEKDDKNALVQLALGDAYNLNQNQNEAYLAYRKAFELDPTLLRAKMQLGVLLKGAKSYDEAIKAYNEVIAINPNYGPVYRELAETYYKWGRNKASKTDENMKMAIGHYEKYMTLTDKSLNSRMRHADFLILAKDYKALEMEANKMIEMDKVNPRIYRYLGYSAYENGNVDVAIKSLDGFIANPSNKVIAKDYLYLGMSKLKKATTADSTAIDPVMYDAALVNIKKAIELEPTVVEDLNEIGKKLFGLKFYKQAAAIFEFGTTNAEFKNYLEDNVYYGLSVFYANNQKDVKPDLVALQKADTAFSNVITASPTYLDAILYRARTNSLMGNDAMTIQYYQEFVAKTIEKGSEEMANPAVVKKVVESYNTIAASYANTDKVKAIEYFNKTLALDPTNNYAMESIKILK